jgi:predicted transcriptional regulator
MAYTDGPQLGLAKAVRLLRGKAKMNQVTLARKADISPSWLCRIEGGECDPTWGHVRRIASGLEVSLEALADLAEEFENANLQG